MNETKRLLGVMEKHLANRDYLAGSYSIADIAIYPWQKSDKSHRNCFGRRLSQNCSMGGSNSC
ncbi:MAG: glutathione binding-like protein [Pseudanabaena sp.]